MSVNRDQNLKEKIMDCRLQVCVHQLQESIFELKESNTELIK
jgi:hypothetical protein